MSGNSADLAGIQGHTCQPVEKVINGLDYTDFQGRLHRDC